MLWTGTRPLEKQRQLLYILQNGHLPRVQSGVGDRGPGRVNGSGPTVKLCAVEVVGIEPTGCAS